MQQRYQKKEYSGSNQGYSSGYRGSRGGGRGGKRGGGRGRGRGGNYRGGRGGQYGSQQPQYAPRQGQDQPEPYPPYNDYYDEYGQEYYDEYGQEFYNDPYYSQQQQPQPQYQTKTQQYQPKQEPTQNYRQITNTQKEEEKVTYQPKTAVSLQSSEFRPSASYQPKQQQQQQNQISQVEREYEEMYGEEYGYERDDYFEGDNFDDYYEKQTQDTKSVSSKAHSRRGYEENQYADYGYEDMEYEEDQTQMNEISNYNFARGPRQEKPNNPCNVMMVAEKPSIALSISEALSKNFSKKNGVAKQCPIYTFKRDFKGYQANFRVTSVAGHVYNRDFPIDYQDRRRDPSVLFDAPTVRKLDKSSRVIAKHLQAVSKNIDFVVLWLDCDKEGENICYEVLDICKRNIPSSKMQRVFRAKFSSIAKKDIEGAFYALNQGPNHNESVSVDARQIMDLKIGVSFSRFQTFSLGPLLKGQSVRMVTYGPCQTPTLGFCVDQAERIKKFIPEPFWKIEPVIADSSGKVFQLKWMRGKIYDRTVARLLHARINGESKAKVTNVVKSQGVLGRPIGLNTVKMLKVASKTFGMSSHETMKIAEHLYLRGFITYPRTESTNFSSNFNFKEILSQHQSHSDWGNIAVRLLSQGINKPKKGVDQGDHPPITPVKSANRGQLSDREWKLYNYITRTFLGCISSDALYDEVLVQLDVGSEQFKLKGQILKELGFLEVMPWMKAGDKEIPLFKQGQQVDVKAIRLQEGKTQPPGYLTEAKLISLMEKNGIGTDASIPTHINNIIERQYVYVQEPGRALVPSPLGYALVKGYCSIDPELVLPTIRSNIEKSCELIAKGKADFNTVVNHVMRMFKKKFEFFKLSIGTMEKLFAVMLAQTSRSTKDIFLKSKIAEKEEEKRTQINFCIRCFKGYFTLQYHKQKGFGIKCDQCKFRVQICEGAAKIDRENEKCEECDSFKLTVLYKDKNPFPGNNNVYTGCILCDSILNQYVINYFTKKQKKPESELTEEEKKEKEERIKKIREEKQLKKIKRQEEEKKQAELAKNKKKEDSDEEEEQKKKKKKKNKQKIKGPDLMTDEERMNQFMKKFA